MERETLSVIISGASSGSGQALAERYAAQMAIVARMLRVVPNRLYDWLFANAPRKPRRRSER